VLDPALPFDPELFSFGSVLSNVVTVGGRVRGAWRRRVSGVRVQVDIRLLGPLSPDEVEAASRAADRMGRYLGRAVELTGLRS
jgi:hypothetical protein